MAEPGHRHGRFFNSLTLDLDNQGKLTRDRGDDGGRLSHILSFNGGGGFTTQRDNKNEEKDWDEETREAYVGALYYLNRVMQAQEGKEPAGDICRMKCKAEMNSGIAQKHCVPCGLTDLKCEYAVPSIECGATNFETNGGDVPLCM